MWSTSAFRHHVKYWALESILAMCLKLSMTEWGMYKYIFLWIVWDIMNSLRVLMPGCKVNFDCRVSPCLPPLCLPPVWTGIWRQSSTGLPVEGCQIQSCSPVCAMLGKVKWVVCPLHQCIAWLSPQRCLTFKKWVTPLFVIQCKGVGGWFWTIFLIKSSQLFRD